MQILKDLQILETGIDKDSLKGKVYFKLEDVQVKGFEPLEEIADKAFRKERFENIKFAPIFDTVYIANRAIQIPQMQIQSNAINFFIEGHLNHNHTSNLWITIPLSNLKRRDAAVIPELRHIEHLGNKIYVEVKEDSLGKFDYKLHLNNKKYYEERGILNQYKEDKKEEERSRKEYKKSERALKKEERKNEE